MSERLPSLELLLELVRAERATQQGHFDGLDNKAGIVLGFAGLLVTQVSALAGVWLIAGTVAAAAAGAMALSAFWPRPHNYLQPTPLRRYVAAEDPFTRLTVFDTLEVMVNETSDVLHRKGSRLRWAMIALAVAAATFAGGILDSGLRGDPDVGPGTEPPGSESTGERPPS